MSDTAVDKNRRVLISVGTPFRRTIATWERRLKGCESRESGETCQQITRVEMRSDFHGEEVDGGNSFTFPPGFDSLKKKTTTRKAIGKWKRNKSGSGLPAGNDGMSAG